MKAFSFLGDASLPYRALMSEQQDFRIGDVLIPVDRLVIAEQTHSALAHECREEDSGAGIGTHPQIAIADALITNVPGQFIMVRTADCTPVIITDRRLRAVAAIHSGREGTRKNICSQTIRQMLEDYGCEPGDLVAEIGAGICAEHYEVSPEIWAEYAESISNEGIDISGMAYRHPNVRFTILQQLLKAGIKAENIRVSEFCTFESDAYFSYRKNGSHNRQMNIAGILL